MIPVAHLDDWGFIWVFYVLPVVIVIVGTVTSARTREPPRTRGGRSEALLVVPYGRLRTIRNN